MYYFRRFRSITLLVLYILFGWCAIRVHGGCQRTNPGWISSDEEKDHSTAPLLSFLPGNELMKQFYSNVEDWNLSATITSLCNYSLFVLQVLILYQHPGTDLWFQYITNVMTIFKFGPRRQVNWFWINIFHSFFDNVSWDVSFLYRISFFISDKGTNKKFEPKMICEKDYKPKKVSTSNLWL